MPVKRGRNFIFTANNYEADWIDKLKAISWITYCRVGKEVSESGTPHLQGYIQCNKAMTATATAKNLKKAGVQCHVEIAKGSLEDNEKYCAKQGDWEEWGISKKESQGKRNDIHSFLKAAETSEELKLAREHPREYAKYWKAAERIKVMVDEEREKSKLKEEMRGKELRPWQVEAIKRLETQNDRQVLWYVDYDGGQGKTWLAKWLIAEKEAFYMQGGKTADIAHAYKGEEFVVCDFTRDKEETVQYSAIESLKNGIIFSPKYDSRTKVKAQGAKVIVFSNWDPDESKLSDDRWDIVRLGEPKPWCYMYEKAKTWAADE